MNSGFVSILNVLILLGVAFVQPSDGRLVSRVYNGVDDIHGKYPYVVALVDDYRHCTGTLISPNWVLTAAHCFWHATHIQFGNMSVLPNDSKKTRTILKMVMPSANTFWTNDIGLLRVRRVSLKAFGRLSAVDYSTMQGLAVQYAGFGSTYDAQDTNKYEIMDLDDQRPLQLGEGVVTSCELEEITTGPFVCVSPRCANSRQDTLPGDSGGPLFLDGKLVAVLHGGPVSSIPISYYTPVSPYLSWIHHVLTTPPNFTNIGFPFFPSFNSKNYVAQKFVINSVVQGWFKKPSFT